MGIIHHCFTPACILVLRGEILRGIGSFVGNTGVDESTNLVQWWYYRYPTVTKYFNTNGNLVVAATVVFFANSNLLEFTSVTAGKTRRECGGGTDPPSSIDT